MRNLYPGNCIVCGRKVASGDGFFQSKGSLPKDVRNKIYGKWLIRCNGCVGQGNTKLIEKLRSL